MPDTGNWELTATRPITIVSNIERAVAFYNRICFEEVFRNDVVYSVLKSGDHYVHLGRRMDDLQGLSQTRQFCRPHWQILSKSKRSVLY
jgi:hypothetical protein